MGYKDEQVLPHLFPTILDDLPNKWYKMEEPRGKTFKWNELKENFLKYFKFISNDELLVDPLQHFRSSRSFIETL